MGGLKLLTTNKDFEIFPLRYTSVEMTKMNIFIIRAYFSA